MFAYEYNEMGSQIARAIESLETFEITVEQNETAHALKKLNKLQSKIDSYEEEDFEELVDKFAAIFKNWVIDVTAAGFGEEAVKVMDYVNFEVIKIEEGSNMTDNAKYISRVFKLNDTPKGIVMNTVYAYVCNYIVDGEKEYSVIKADVVVK